ncbi:hypothetical protein HBH89_251930 [Parastagonospora nodorum]|nr:hypothetical protein HBH89_251930 [Parastagonospora nodorum]
MGATPGALTGEHVTPGLIPTFGGEKAVEGWPVTGAKELRKEESQSVNVKEL